MRIARRRLSTAPFSTATVDGTILESGARRPMDGSALMTYLLTTRRPTAAKGDWTQHTKSGPLQRVPRVEGAVPSDHLFFAASIHTTQASMPLDQFLLESEYWMTDPHSYDCTR